VVERAVRGRLSASFARLDRTLAAATAAAERATRPGAASVATSAVGETDGDLLKASPSRPPPARELGDVFTGGLAEVLEDARALLEERPAMLSSWKSEFQGFVKAKCEASVSGFLRGLIASGRLLDSAPSGFGSSEEDGASSIASEFEDPDREDASSSVFLLICSRVAECIAEDGVDAARARLEECFRTSLGKSGSDDGDGEGDGFEALREDARRASSFLASAYVLRTGIRISAMVRRTMRVVNWAESREPRDVRPVADAVLDELERVSAEARRTKETFSSETPHSIGTPPTTIIGAVACFVLRSLRECIALCTFSRGGYHQMELDLAYLSPRVALCFTTGPRSETASDQRAVDSLFAECRRVASERSLDPTPLDPAIISRILDAKRSRGG
jgi:hypothetical protein